MKKNPRRTVRSSGTRELAQVGDEHEDQDGPGGHQHEDTDEHGEKDLRFWFRHRRFGRLIRFVLGRSRHLELQS